MNSFTYIFYSISILAVDMCENGKHKCSQNASCIFTGPAQYNCSCLEGFRGDGYVCTPIDPCQEMYGGCNFTTSICTYRSPGKVQSLLINKRDFHEEL